MVGNSVLQLLKRGLLQEKNLGFVINNFLVPVTNSLAIEQLSKHDLSVVAFREHEPKTIKTPLYKVDLVGTVHIEHVIVYRQNFPIVGEPSVLIDSLIEKGL